MSSSFFGDFMFRPGASAPAARRRQNRMPQPPRYSRPRVASLPRAAPALAGRAGAHLGGLYLRRRHQPERQPLPRHGRADPAGDQYRFTWWIARQVFSGVGQFAGRMLVVNWGAKSPVIYIVARNDDLDGEWADGSADRKARAVRARRAAARAARPRAATPSPAAIRTAPAIAARVNIARHGRPLSLRLAGRLVELSRRRHARRQRADRELGRRTPVVYALGGMGF